VADDADLVARARFLATQAREDAPHYEHTTVGYNYRLSNLLAAIGRGQLEDLPAKIARRAELGRRYREALTDVDGVGFLPEAPWGEPNHWLTVLTIDPARTGTTAAEVAARLAADDIEARPAWKPMHLQPLYADAPMVGGAVSERVFATGLCVPSGSSLTDADHERVVASLRAALGAGTGRP
jgi:dTDP-4-amino-4,6-dideoxygalactose transaminase